MIVRMKDNNCDNCPFKEHRFVGPEGNIKSKLVIIGEAPGWQEEKVGRPFVGGAGDMLNKWLASVNIQRSDAYITNVVKCRPPSNRLDSSEGYQAVRCCQNKLNDELQHMSARVIVPMGNTAIHALGLSNTISTIRGTVFVTGFGKVIPTWHPAYVMRQFSEYVTAIYDWRKIARHLSDPTIPQHIERFILNPTVEVIEKWVADTLERVDKGLLTHIAIDTETGISNNVLTNPLKMIGFATSEQDAIVIPFKTQAGCWNWSTVAENTYVIQLVARILEDQRITKVIQNSLFDVAVLMSHGWEIRGPIFDTMLARFLTYNQSTLNLGYLVSIYADFPAWKLNPGVTDMEYRTYNARDCIVLNIIKPSLEEDMRTNGVIYCFNNLMKVIIPTVQMMINGVGIDTKLQKEVIAHLSGRKTALLSQLRELSKHPDFNPNSPIQLKSILFDEMKLKSSVHTDKGALSTGKDVLNRLSLRYPDNAFIDRMLEYRSVDKRLSTYGNPPLLDDGRVHTHYKLTIPTGRYGSENPPMQNLPSRKRGDPDGIIRRMYAAQPGYIFLAGDLSQAELVTVGLIAHVSEWLECWENGGDVHKINGAALTGEYIEAYRIFYKNFIFGWIYGSAGNEIEKVAPKELIQRLSIKEVIANFEAHFPELLAYRETILKQLKEKKRVRNLYGRAQFYVGELTNDMIRSAYNHPIQGTVADFMHERMDMVNKEIDITTDKLIIQEHDALKFEVKEDRVEQVARILKQIMEYPSTTPAGITLKYACELEKGYNLDSFEDRPEKGLNLNGLKKFDI
jgi:uracil-DNA glycosylase family 4